MDKHELEAMLMRKNDIQCELRQINHDLCQEIMNFQGSVREALEIGLIKPNFSAPAGFKRMMENNKR